MRASAAGALVRLEITGLRLGSLTGLAVDHGRVYILNCIIDLL
jgi:hypothetical protein